MLIAACQEGSFSFDNHEMVNEAFQGTLTISLGAIRPNVGTLAPGPLASTQSPLYDKLRAFQDQYDKLSLEIDSIDDIWNLEKPDPFPDVVELVPYQVRWVADGELEELEYVFQTHTWSGAYGDLIERMKVGGDTWLLPLKAEPLIMFYDEVIFDELHLMHPHEDWTWDELLSASSQLSEHGYDTIMPDSFDGIEPMIRGFGGHITSPDGTMFSGYLDSEETITAFDRYLTFYRSLQHGESTRFDRAALGISWPSQIHKLIHENPSIRFARMPIFPDGERHNTMFATGLALSSLSNKQTAAIALMSEIIERDDQEAIRFSNYVTLISREPKYRDEPPERMQELLDVMEQETAIASPSPFQLTTHVRHYYGALEHYPGTFTNLFPKFIGQESSETMLRELADFIDVHFTEQRGNWNGR